MSVLLTQRRGNASQDQDKILVQKASTSFIWFVCLLRLCMRVESFVLYFMEQILCFFFFFWCMLPSYWVLQLCTLLIVLTIQMQIRKSCLDCNQNPLTLHDIPESLSLNEYSNPCIMLCWINILLHKGSRMCTHIFHS